jgi:hypothetical protein
VGEPGLPRAPLKGGGGLPQNTWAKRPALHWIDAPRRAALTPTKEWRRPAQKAEDAALALPYRRRVIFYAVVSDEIHQVIQFFRTPAEAEAMLETVLEDEPPWRDVLYVDRVELVTGGLD